MKTNKTMHAALTVLYIVAGFLALFGGLYMLLWAGYCAGLPM